MHARAEVWHERCNAPMQHAVLVTIRNALQQLKQERLAPQAAEQRRCGQRQRGHTLSTGSSRPPSQ